MLQSVECDQIYFLCFFHPALYIDQEKKSETKTLAAGKKLSFPV
jgi:hypothetical protein